MRTVKNRQQSISVVIPCYNEAPVISDTVSRLTQVINRLSDYSFELIFIDDGSRDETYEILVRASTLEPRIRVLRFARNFGHQAAVTAGIDNSNGDAVILIDADLQDPPELFERMLSKWGEGYDVVYGVRTARMGESRLKLLTAKYFYRFLNHLSEVEIPLDTGDFRLMSRRVVQSLVSMRENDRFIRGMVSWVGFRQVGIEYQRHERAAGVTKYPLSKMIKLALDGIVSFSNRPLKLASTLGFGAATFAALGIAYAIILRVFTEVWVEGWTALMIAILFLGGVQLICIGILGEYLGRIYQAGKGRPLYILSDTVNLSNSN